MKNVLITICVILALISGCCSEYDERAEHHKECIAEIEQYLDISGVRDSGILFGWKQGEDVNTI